MATVYTLLASAVPAPIIPSAMLSIAGAVPNVASAVVAGSGGSGSLSTPFNKNATALDVLGRAGAGAYAIDWDSNPASAVLPGLDLTVSSGLTLAIAAGQAVMDSVRQLLAPTTFVCTDNIARIYLWYSQAGVFSAVHNSTTPPAGIQVFAGSIVTSGGAITAIDGSGVMYYLGSQLVRQTADTGTPTDAPPAGLSFFNKCPGGLFFWDGANWQNVSGYGIASLAFSSDANKTLSAAESTNRYLSFGAGTTLTATRNVVLPLLPGGRHWTVDNQATGGQSLQFIGATGTGTTVATTKRAEIMSNGTNIVRVTPDT